MYRLLYFQPRDERDGMIAAMLRMLRMLRMRLLEMIDGMVLHLVIFFVITAKTAVFFGIKKTIS
jgi:hypothetical protein